ncbi:MAG: diguanylate cyclase [Deltaproteobacteria bacterium]|nr:diguanylate cyclase [Deltaproteobacteria bacterium]
MKICIPIDEDKGLRSPVCAHFGSAPLFMVIDTDTGNCQTIENKNKIHQHGKCQPLSSFTGVALDGVVVGGIGKGALNKLRAAGVQVFLSKLATVDEAIAAHKAGTLELVTPATACGHHDHGDGEGCGHGHDEQQWKLVDPDSKQ